MKFLIRNILIYATLTFSVIVSAFGLDRNISDTLMLGSSYVVFPVCEKSLGVLPKVVKSDLVLGDMTFSEIELLEGERIGFIFPRNYYNYLKDQYRFKNKEEFKKGYEYFQKINERVNSESFKMSGEHKKGSIFLFNTSKYLVVSIPANYYYKDCYQLDNETKKGLKNIYIKCLVPLY